MIDGMYAIAGGMIVLLGGSSLEDKDSGVLCTCRVSSLFPLKSLVIPSWCSLLLFHSCWMVTGQRLSSLQSATVKWEMLRRQASKGVSINYVQSRASVTVGTHIAEMTVAVSQKLALLRIASELRWSRGCLLVNKREEQHLAVLLTVWCLLFLSFFLREMSCK